MRSIPFYFVWASLVWMIACGSAPSSVEGESTSNDVESAAANEAPAGALSRTESKTVLKLLDDICGDTWCEGDHDFRFLKIGCHESSATCTLFFLMFPYDTSPSVASLRSCKTGNFAGFASLVETDSQGVPSLTAGYYDAISSCIARLEERSSSTLSPR
ncbi:MAG: hypothetical protein ABW133_04510 [Polyangiaceae bacterium]